jgi:hypothetical protein
MKCLNSVLKWNSKAVEMIEKTEIVENASTILSSETGGFYLFFCFSLLYLKMW